jgi:hypothetical protein
MKTIRKIRREERKEKRRKEGKHLLKRTRAQNKNKKVRMFTAFVMEF